MIRNENVYCLNAFHVKNTGDEQALWLIYALLDNAILLLRHGTRNGNKTVLRVSSSNVAKKQEIYKLSSTTARLHGRNMEEKVRRRLRHK